MPDSRSPLPHSLSDSAEEIALREAWFRAQTVLEFLDFKKTIKILAQENEQLRAQMVERDTQIHLLNLARLEDSNRLNASFKDLEDFTFLLQAAEDQQSVLRQKWDSFRSSFSGKLLQPLAAAEQAVRDWGSKPRRPATQPVPAAHFTYYLYTPPYRIYRESSFLLRGWVFLERGEKKIETVRVRIDDREFPGKYGLEAPDAVAQNAAVSNLRPGFEVRFDTPPGRHQFALEAHVAEEGWRSILTHPIWVMPIAGNIPSK